MRSLVSFSCYIGLAAVIATLTSNASAFEQLFTDVYEHTQHQESIHELAALDVLQGNPNGYFYPSDDVNRAEFLKILYEANGIDAVEQSTSCFDDVPGSAWFAKYVCDASQRGWVSGYADNNFRPAQKVNRVEAIKMIVTVFGLDLKPDTYIPVVNYLDVDENQWYYPYLQIVYTWSILPVEGQNPYVLEPERNVTRAEAAAFISNTFSRELRLEEGSEAEADTEEGDDLVNTEDSDRPKSTVSTNPSDLPEISIPWNSEAQFEGNRSKAYVFNSTKEQTITISVEQKVNANNAPRCALYKLNESGISYEYYLGSQLGKTCTIVTTIYSGEYQVQFSPTVSDAEYIATITESIHGDGNDSFREAKQLSMSPQEYKVPQYNTHDWYKFSLYSEQQQAVFISNSEQLTCIIYPMENVDIYGFEGPQCNEPYLYPEGDYYVSVQRKTLDLNRETNYSIYRR